MKKIFVGLFAGLVFLSATVFAENSEDASKDPKQLELNLTWKHGSVLLGQDLATLQASSSFRYLSPEDAKTVLVKIWNNPPQSVEGILGMIFPQELNPTDPGSWAVVISYKEDGYVKDDEAATINYDDLLRRIQKETRDANPERIKQGYKPMQMVGWAAPPHYDSRNHKLYWAEELQFGESRIHTLNYSIRVLGRSGVLILNAVAATSQLREIEQRMPEVLSIVEFNSGNRYTDFNSATDKVAKYGIAALIFGGVAAKAGLFKVILGLLLAAKKFVVLAIVAVVAYVNKLFRRKNKSAVSGPSAASGPSQPLE
jgi:uncharacterized membrane-anchored protein